jgi:hypothetical protein
MQLELFFNFSCGGAEQYFHFRINKFEETIFLRHKYIIQLLIIKCFYHKIFIENRYKLSLTHLIDS